MPVSQIIAEKLQAAFTPASLTVNDDSAAHAGHAGARPGGEPHFSVRIVSEHFTGLSRLERQRAVHAALAAELAMSGSGPVHALVIAALTPGEASSSAASPAAR